MPRRKQRRLKLPKVEFKNTNTVVREEHTLLYHVLLLGFLAFAPFIFMAVFP